MDRHNWYYRFKPDVAWMEDFCEDVETADRDILLALSSTQGVASGLVVTENDAGQDFSVDVSAGVAYDDIGRRIFNASGANVPFDTDYLGADIEVVTGGNSRIVSVYAHYNLVDDTGTVTVDGNGATVYLESNEEVEFVLVQGAEDVSPVAAADPGNHGVLLANVTITNGDSTIANANINTGVKYTLGLQPGADSVGEDEVDWGLGAGQVSAEDVPIRDTDGNFAATNVETALAEAAELARSSDMPASILNLRLSLSAGTLSIVGANGSALSSTNPGYVTVPSETPGKNVNLKVTGAHSFNDDAHASSDLTNLGFGITEAADWAEDMPFFLYVVNVSDSDIDATDGTSKFAISRSPWLTQTPASGNDIGDTGAIPSNDSLGVILILGDVTLGTYNAKPVRLIGAFRMRWSTGTDDWTVQALSFKDGFGDTQLAKIFASRWVFPTGQRGAASGKFSNDDGFTGPVFSTNQYFYYITRDGFVRCEVWLDGDGGTDGATAAQLRLVTPYPFTTSLTQYLIGTGWVSCIGITAACLALTGSGIDYFVLATYDLADVNADDFSNGSKNMNLQLTFRAV